MLMSLEVGSSNKKLNLMMMMIEKLKLKLKPNEMSARIAKLGLELNDIFISNYIMSWKEILCMQI